MAMTFATDVNTNGYSLKIDKISAPTSSNGSTFGAGSAGQILRSNGTKVYWANGAGVDQAGSTTANWRKLLMHTTSDSASTAAVTSTTGTAYAALDISAQPSTGSIRANIYNVKDKCNIQWNATTESIDFVFV